MPTTTTPPSVAPDDAITAGPVIDTAAALTAAEASEVDLISAAATGMLTGVAGMPAGRVIQAALMIIAGLIELNYPHANDKQAAYGAIGPTLHAYQLLAIEAASNRSSAVPA